MKTLIVIFSLVFLPVISLTQERERSLSSDTVQQRMKEEIINTDNAFNKMCQKDGMAKAFVEFAADDVILMRQSQFPIIGKAAVTEHYSAIKKLPAITWSPRKADVAASGDLGYTFGNWELKDKTNEGKDTTLYGVYVSIWKKQPDGAWKYVLDGGASTPPPLNTKR